MSIFICTVIGICILVSVIHLILQWKCNHSWTEWHEVGPIHDRYLCRKCIKCQHTEIKDFNSQK